MIPTPREPVLQPTPILSLRPTRLHDLKNFIVPGLVPGICVFYPWTRGPHGGRTRTKPID